MSDSSLRTAIARALGEVLDGQGAMHCTRVWEAGGCGTMGEEDFSFVTDDESALNEIADAVLKVLASPSAEVVGRAAERYVRSDFGCQCVGCTSTAKERVRGVLAALVGGEGDGL